MWNLRHRRSNITIIKAGSSQPAAGSFRRNERIYYMAVRNFKDLIVWQKSMDLAAAVYKLIRELPREELYTLSDQMRSAVISIPSNIAEGQQRTSDKEFKHFLSVAKGSLGEIETQLLLCVRLEYLTSEQIKQPLELCTETGKMLNGLINSIQLNSGSH